jgi:diadenosine tetraphosphate (Ap4A) HIT family hydrolase
VSAALGDSHTALWQLAADQPHREMGGGLFCILQMPHQVDDEKKLAELVIAAEPNGIGSSGSTSSFCTLGKRGVGIPECSCLNPESPLNPRGSVNSKLAHSAKSWLFNAIRSNERACPIRNPVFAGNTPQRMKKCPFCYPATSSVWLESSSALALWDSFPVSEGHTLVVPRCHVSSLFDLRESELSLVWEFVARVRKHLIGRFRVASFNIGLNDGLAAGQTVMHAHIHIVPRRNGDVTDPRGGVRWVIPGKAAYWTRRP